MAPSRMLKLSELDLATYSGFDNAAQTVGAGLGVLIGREDKEIKNRFIKLMAEAGDDVSPSNVAARAKQFWKTHQTFQETDKAGQALPKPLLAQYYSIVSHLLPEGDTGQQGVRNFFAKAGIAGVQPRDEAVENFAEMYNIERKGQGRA